MCSPAVIKEVQQDFSRRRFITALGSAGAMLAADPSAAQQKDLQPSGASAPKKEKEVIRWRARATWEGHVAKVNRLAFSPVFFALSCGHAYLVGRRRRR